jgi:methylenetetrahydrofolate dehydrogenase (NADP+) / methenyltetrahydrofolate cyclohydrolase
MSAKIIDGKAIAESLREDVKNSVRERVSKRLPAPGLATVIIGNNPASKVYVRMKQKACQEAGILSVGHELPKDTDQEQVEALVRKLNADPDIHGILVQLPLPAGLDEESVLNTIDIHKDVDGFHPINIGRLAQKGREPLFIPATPSGIMFLLEHSGAKLDSAQAVVLGRSNIVGMPISLLLVKANSTVTICHSHTKDIPTITREADILIAAVGRAEFVRGDWIKPGATVIDVGVNRVDDHTRKRGYRLVGDVAFNEAVEVAGAITPVPGGVGPMTIAMLLRNTLRAARLADGNDVG